MYKVYSCPVKYDSYKLAKQTVFLCCLVILSLTLDAQDTGRHDTVPVLKYELDTTVATELPDEEPPAEENIAQEDSSDNAQNGEYFLRKEFTGGFSDSIDFRQLPDSVIKKLRGDNAFWYANEVFKRKAAGQRDSFMSNPVFQSFLWVVIIAGFITFLAVYLANSNISLFRKSSAIISEEETIDTDDIFGIHYSREIEKAVGMNNYRLAVRLMFLRLLKNLSDKNIIQYQPDRTNYDYLLQLQSTRSYPDFFRITRHYEYSWYGQFDIDKEKFAMIRKEFESFERKL